jgi:hypothetical protein
MKFAIKLERKPELMPHQQREAITHRDNDDPVPDV